MKKSFFGKALSLLAAGALLFGALGCDTGNDDPVPVEEKPTVYSVKSESFTGGSATAVWDFSSWTANTLPAEGNLGDAATIVDSAKTGEGASIDWSSAKGKSNTGVLQFSKGTASLDSLGNAWYFTLTLDAAANIYIKAKGAGAADAARLIAIYSGTDRIVYKGSIDKGSDTEFVVIGAPAGDYTVYANGVSIYTIDLSKATSAITEPKGYRDNADLIIVSGETVKKTVNDADIDGKVAVTPTTSKVSDDVENDMAAEDSTVKEKSEWDETKYGGWTATRTKEVTGEQTVYSGVDVKVDDVNGTKIYTAGGTTAATGTPTKDATLTAGKTEFEYYPIYKGRSSANPDGTVDSIESLIESVKLALFDKDGNNVTLNAVWTSSDTSIATVKDGVVSGASISSKGEVKIRARIGAYYQDVWVNVTPCTKTVVRFIDGDKLPAVDEVIDFENPSDNYKAAFTPTLLGDNFVTVKENSVSFAMEENVVYNTGGEPKLWPKGAEGTEKVGLWWTENGAKGEKTIATLKFTVVPAAGRAAFLGMKGQVFGGKASNIISYTGSTKNSGNLVTNKKDVETALEQNPVVFEGETEIKVQVVIPSSTNQKVSFSVQDLELFFGSAE